MTLDLWGNSIQESLPLLPAPLSPAERDEQRRERARLRAHERTIAGNPLIPLYGPGPEGKRCGDCAHCWFKRGGAGSYYKCALRGDTNGPGTDHRVRWPACGRFEAGEGSPRERWERAWREDLERLRSEGRPA